jgi:hypothetical protein
VESLTVEMSFLILYFVTLQVHKMEALLELVPVSLFDYVFPLHINRGIQLSSVLRIFTNSIWANLILILVSPT